MGLSSGTTSCVLVVLMDLPKTPRDNVHRTWSDDYKQVSFLIFSPPPPHTHTHTHTSPQSHATRGLTFAVKKHDLEKENKTKQILKN